VKGSFKLGDTLSVTGKAKAFSGSNIDGATVSYRVVRMVNFPYRPYWYYRYNPYQRPEMEIANGVMKTDAQGNFIIPFEAKPDASIPADQKPEFRYKVMADVTDITGETRWGEWQIAIGYIALSANINIPEKISKEVPFPLNITTKNLAGEFEPALVEVHVQSLKEPEVVYKNRFWEKPDVFLLPEAAFKQKFPTYAYKNEDDRSQWSPEDTRYTEKIDTRLKRKWALPVQDWPEGSYRLTMTTADKYGQTIKIQKYFEIYDLNSSALAVKAPLWINHPNKSFAPGEQAKIILASSMENARALVELEKKGKIISRQWKNINGKEEILLDISEGDRGNFHYHVTLTTDNRTYQRQYTVLVPWSNKELKITYATFRDKLKPGEEEEWQIKISGPKSEKVAAEMVAAMYDASLDEFAPTNNWKLDVYPTYGYPNVYWNIRGFSSQRSYTYSRNWQPEFVRTSQKTYQQLNWFNFPFYGGRIAMSRKTYSRDAPEAMMEMVPSPPPPELMEMSVTASQEAEAAQVEEKEEVSQTEDKESGFEGVGIRTNLNETVFFIPDLQTDEEGNIVLKFKMNEALTRWKFLGLATTKDLQIATTSREVVTQKELMVVPNAPRFLREGDQITFSAKVSNLSDQDLKGEARLELLDALTREPVNELLGLTTQNKSFSVKAGQSSPLSWNLKIPKGKILALTHRVVAKAGNFSDGEESSIPVVTNRMLVTETLPLALRGKETKKFTLEGLKNAASSSTMSPHNFSLEFTSNPAWYAVQALPYLMEYPYDCTEQIFNRFYANTLASTVANAHPKLKSVFEQWKETPALESNLSKNQELKSALLEETPWVLAAQSEAAQKKNIGLLFDLNRMAEEQALALAKIYDRQLENGGFAWFPGGRDSWYITQYLVEGMGHLKKLNALDTGEESELEEILNDALGYLDDRLAEKYNRLLALVKDGKTTLETNHLDNIAIHYLYTRSFFQDEPVAAAAETAFNYYLGQAEKYWLNRGIYQEGMIGLALDRYERPAIPKQIIKSLKERALQSEELGMYWNQPGGFYWYQLPMETHALMIELFQDVAADAATVNELKIWLLKNKQTNHWKTTKATSAVVYALLMSGENWLLDDQPLKISLGNSSKYKKQIDRAQQTAEAGTGYFKTSWSGSEMDAEMASIRVKNPNRQPAWGAAYWQYFEDLDKINTFKETPLTIEKQLFRELASDQGPKMEVLSDQSTLHPGDKVKVRIEIRVDRAMEYVHLKDMRASGFEPINVLSGYKWQGGLGYYESTGDLATNFFIDYLPKGTYVFEYPLRVTHKGDFSNGITSMQCMYAPEFSSHSEGIRVKVN